MAGIKRGIYPGADTASKSSEILAVSFQTSKGTEGELAFVGLKKLLKISFLVLDG